MEGDSLIKLRLDILTKFRLLVWIAVVSVAFVICFIIAMFAPHLFETDSYILHNCGLEVSLPCLPAPHEAWTSNLNGFEPENRFLFMSITPVHDEDISFSVEVEVSLSGKKSEDDKDPELIFTEADYHTFECKDDDCEPVLIFYEPYVEYPYYVATFTFQHEVYCRELKYTLSVVNQSFTRFELGSKTFFLITSVISLGLYLWRLRRVTFRIWPFESKAVLVLSVSLILFNQPLLGASIYSPNEELSGFSVFCVLQFVAVLLCFWFCTFTKPLRLQYKFVLYICEGVLVFVLFVLAMVAYVHIDLEFKHNPTYKWHEDFRGTYTSAYVGFLVFLAFCATALLLHIVIAFRTLSDLSKRQRGMLYLNVILIALTFTGLGIGAYQPFPRDGALMLVYIGMLNAYVYFLAVLYAPTAVCIRHFEQQNDGKMNQFDLPLDILADPSKDELSAPPAQPE